MSRSQERLQFAHNSSLFPNAPHTSIKVLQSISPYFNTEKNNKQIKTSTHSTQFQIHEQRGTFNGIDPFSLTYFHHVHFTSKISADFE